MQLRTGQGAGARAQPCFPPLSVLKESGLVRAEHDSEDARWIYYSIDTGVLQEVRELLARFLATERIQPRKINCRYRQNS